VEQKLVASSFSLRIPNEPVEPDLSSVKMMATEITLELVIDLIESKATVFNAAGEAPKCGAKVGILRSIFITLEIGKPYDHVGRIAVTIGNNDFDKVGSIRPYGD
jgi:hypothetical protein